jgi:hypothetical protein
MSHSVTYANADAMSSASEEDNEEEFYIGGITRTASEIYAAGTPTHDTDAEDLNFDNLGLKMKKYNSYRGHEIKEALKKQRTQKH